MSFAISVEAKFQIVIKPDPEKRLNDLNNHCHAMLYKRDSVEKVIYKMIDTKKNNTEAYKQTVNEYYKFYLRINDISTKIVEEKNSSGKLNIASKNQHIARLKKEKLIVEKDMKEGKCPVEKRKA